MPQPVLEVHGLVKRFGKGKTAVTALDGLDLAVPPGELFGLIGPNGSGKTTLIRILTGLDRPTEGVARLRGGDPLAMRQHVGYMPQEEALYVDLSVEENVEFFAGLYERPDPERVRAALESVHLFEDRARVVGDLSGGMRRRASLASTLAHRPDVLFLDEPTVGVDPVLRLELWEAFRAMARAGASIIITTHHMEEARRCDRIGFIHKGRMLTTGRTEDLLREAGADNLEDAFLHFRRRANVAA
ncbi:MAG TPA: ABC transporter ATP-binding protein [Candidatus Thermoplasmatota archaeon]|nr:ABC transporter ATP-binding protein [Candidatus Thermoplasmatota archaeon]